MSVSDRNIKKFFKTIELPNTHNVQIPTKKSIFYRYLSYDDTSIVWDNVTTPLKKSGVKIAELE